MIAVTFALPAESSAFVRRLKNRRRQGMIRRGHLQGCDEELGIIHTGVGAAECERRLPRLLEKEQPRLLISSGFCGGTLDELSPGTVVIGENYSDRALAQKAQAALPRALMGKIFSADEVIDPARQRYAIGREHNAIGIDMETETIARICRQKNIPMLSLRVASDSPAAPFPAPPHLLFDLEVQRTKFSRLLPYLARKPAAAFRLMQFSRQIASAREKVAHALCTTIAAL